MKRLFVTLCAALAFSCSESKPSPTTPTPVVTPAPAPTPAPTPMPAPAPAPTPPPPPALSQGNFFTFKSEPGDPVGQGQTLEITDTSSAVSFYGHWETDHRIVNLTAGGGAWRLQFAAPVGQKLGYGTYEGAVSPFSSSNSGSKLPLIHIAGEGRNCVGTGRFTIWEAVFSTASDRHMDRFHANFVQRCPGSSGALIGDVCVIAPNSGPGCPHADMPPLQTSSHPSFLFLLMTRGK
jgi:hypothetical protein